MPIRLKLIRLILAVFIIIICGNAHANETAQDAPEEVKKGTVTGRILLKDGTPLSWGQVMFYDYLSGPPPVPSRYERTPDISKTMDAEGRFKIEVPEGRYYIGAVKRLSGDRLGPPQEGDYIFRSLDEKGRPKEYSVQADKVLDVGTFTGAFQITDKELDERRITTALKGTIVNQEWLPVADAVVIAFTEPYLGKKPLFASNKSDKDGKYILPLTEGTYYLRVRNSFAAGPPEPGQIVGYYGEGTPTPVSIKDCEVIEGIDFQVVVFVGRGPAPRPAKAQEKE
ncbi:MAG: carboxypeptidase regulatory-like domain-containing protein [Nitrospiraceae bacterium]|nr:MAG: carboxypeptidase regulatory-like domain-containing protein [Nitrospiraceae bacterium]